MRRTHLLVTLGAFIFVTFNAKASDITVVRNRMSADYRDVRSPIEVSLTPADQLLSTLQANGSWSDINYSDLGGADWSPRQHLERLLAMSQAYNDPAHALYQNTSLRQGILSAYDRWFTGTPTSSNWWWNDIGGPRRLGRTMVLMNDHLSAAQRTSGLNYLQNGSISQTAQNLVWRADVTAMRGVIAQDNTLTNNAFSAAAGAINIATGTNEGIKADYSFHQHGAQLYNGGYGLFFSTETARLASQSRATAFAFSPAARNGLANYFLEGQQWMMRGNVLDYNVTGRNFTRKGYHERSMEMLNAVDYLLAAGTSRDAELQVFRNRIQAGSPNPADTLVGHKHFWKSDYSVHHRPEFFASLRMRSTRTLGSEVINGEGLQSFYLAEGAMFLYRTGMEYYEIMPVWNWRRLPGTTVEQRSNLPTRNSGDNEYGTTSFVGGVSDGNNGMSAMDYNRAGISGRKSWFFVGDRIIALGANLSAPTTNDPIFTTLNQELLDGTVTVSDQLGQRTITGTNALTGAKWVHHDGVGYIFLQSPSSVGVSATTQTGTWQSINSQYDNTPVQKDVFTTWIDHGSKPSGASYAYMIAPGINTSQTQALWSNPQISILRNDSSVQAIYDSLTSTAQAAFFTASSLNILPQLTVQTDRNLLLMLELNEDHYKLTLSNPLNQPVSGTILISEEFNGVGTWDPISAMSSIPYNLPSGEMAGSSVSYILPLIPEPTLIVPFAMATTGWVLRRRR